MNTPVSGGAVSDEWVKALETAYAALADIRANWHRRDSPVGQRLLCTLRDLICEATGGEAQEVQDRYTALTQPAVPVLASEPVKKLGKRLASLLDEDQWAECEKLLLAIDAAPQPAPTPSHDPAMFRRMQDLWLRCDAHIAKYADAILSGALAAPLASEPEPVAAEQARDFAAWWEAVGSQTYKVAAKEPACTAWCAALASQSTPPPESAGQGLSDAEIDAHIQSHLGKLRDGALTMYREMVRAILAANRTAQPDGGSKA